MRHLRIPSEVQYLRSNNLAKIYGGNKMRVYAQVSEGADPDEFQKEYTKRLKALTKLRNENLAM